jgi:hypothetical protein
MSQYEPPAIIKKSLLILLTLVGLCSSCLAEEHLETGKFKSHRTGRTIIALYVVENGQYKEVHLFMPDGSRIGVACDPEITTQTLDTGLQKIVDAQ